jgi:hypothetical protein
MEVFPGGASSNQITAIIRIDYPHRNSVDQAERLEAARAKDSSVAVSLFVGDALI